MTIGSSRNYSAKLVCLLFAFMICAIPPLACLSPREFRPGVVMEILGHSQIAPTMNTYSHVAPEVSREAADRMARALWLADAEDQADKPDDGESEAAKGEGK